MPPCGNPHLSNQANQMLTCVIILANLSAPIKHYHVIISFHLQNRNPNFPQTLATTSMPSTLPENVAAPRRQPLHQHVTVGSHYFRTANLHAFARFTISAATIEPSPSHTVHQYNNSTTTL